jgi:uncharacterized repeat protein (TIGR03803 family)
LFASKGEDGMNVRGSRLRGTATKLLVLGLGFSAFPAFASETLLYSLHGGSDGATPRAGLFADSSGNLYGTTISGGGTGCGGQGCGTVFRIGTDGSETVLYSFAGGSDGEFPEDRLIGDEAGNLYGTTSQGGGNGCGGGTCGTVFKLTPGGTETVLHSFAGGSDGYFPIAGLVADASGNLYGTTAGGGADNKGTVFKIASGSGIESVLYAFAGGSDGATPIAGVIVDRLPRTARKRSFTLSAAPKRETGQIRMAGSSRTAQEIFLGRPKGAARTNAVLYS